MFEVGIEAFNMVNGNIVILRRWTSSLNACEELEFDEKAIGTAAKTFQDYRSSRTEIVVCACSLMWCYNEVCASAPGFVGSYFYPSLEVREPVNQKKLLYSFSSIQEVVRLLTVSQVDIYNAAIENDKYFNGTRDSLCKLYGVYFRFYDGHNNSSGGVVTMKKKKMRDTIFLRRVKELAASARWNGDLSRISIVAASQPSQSQSESESGVSYSSASMSSPQSSNSLSVADGARGNQPADIMESHGSPTSQRRFLTSPLASTVKPEVKKDAANRFFGHRKLPVVGSNLYQAEDLPECSSSTYLSAIATGGNPLWRPEFESIVQENDLDTLCRSQYVPGLIVKVHDAFAASAKSEAKEPSPDNANEDSSNEISRDASASRMLVGMVVAPVMETDTNVWLAFDEDEVKCFPLKNLQRVIPEDMLLDVFISSGYEMKASIAKIEGLIEEHIAYQWSAEQIELFFKCAHTHRDKVKEIHRAITSGDAGANARALKLSTGFGSHAQSEYSGKPYNTRKFNPFWTPMKQLVSQYYNYHPILEVDDFDEDIVRNKETLDLQKSNIISVSRLSANFRLQSKSEKLGQSISKWREKIEQYGIKKDARGGAPLVFLAQSTPNVEGCNSDANGRSESQSQQSESARSDSGSLSEEELAPLPLPPPPQVSSESGKGEMQLAESESTEGVSEELPFRTLLEVSSESDKRAFQQTQSESNVERKEMDDSKEMQSAKRIKIQ
jgi:hypothetical protein